jgi:tRNA-modifying protein YgfZ
MSTPLQAAAVVELHGKDAQAFAQAQFTSDVAALEVGYWQWSAWLDAQGRARAFFMLARLDAQRLLAWMPIGDAVVLRDALSRYVFRAAVGLELAQGWTLYRLDDGDPPPPRRLLADRGGVRFSLPGRQPRTALLSPGPLDAGEGDDAALQAWRLDDALAGLPLLAPELAGEFVPQALELERLDAIRFDKGCYPGQEIAARLHFRGGNKRGLNLLRLGRPPVPAGTAVDEPGGRAVGRVLYSADAPGGEHCIALAVVEKDFSGKALSIAGGDPAPPLAGKAFLS